jgi:hypothetical protein
MPIADRFRIEVHIPASAVERRAHGFDELLCSLVVRTAKDIELPAADVVLDQLLNDGSNTAVVILGDFGLDVAKSVDGVRATDFELAGHSVYWLTSQSAISAILSANVEALALFRTSPEALERAALDDARRAPDWRSLAKRTSVGALSSIQSIGPVVFYSPSEGSFELPGDERVVLEALNRIVAFTPTANQ